MTFHENSIQSGWNIYFYVKNTLMKIAIITAMREEADHIIGTYDLKEVKRLGTLSIYENETIVLALAGIGKIQASLATAYILENYSVDKLINIGISGSLLGAQAKIGDVFLVSKIAQHDMYLPFDGAHLDYAKKAIDIKTHTYSFDGFDFTVQDNAFCLTGDQFIDDAERVTELRDAYSAHVIEMEAFAIASVAREYDMLDKCIFIKAISDGADNDAIDAHMGNLDFAMQNSLKVL